MSIRFVGSHWGSVVNGVITLEPVRDNSEATQSESRSSRVLGGARELRLALGCVEGRLVPEGRDCFEEFGKEKAGAHLQTGWLLYSQHSDEKKVCTEFDRRLHAAARCTRSAC